MRRFVHFEVSDAVLLAVATVIAKRHLDAGIAMPANGVEHYLRRLLDGADFWPDEHGIPREIGS